MRAFFKSLLEEYVDPDKALMSSTGALIEAVAQRHALGLSPETWTEGEPLKLLFAGYVGTRNTGADVRVEEILRQVRHLLGPEQAELTVMTVEPALSAGYFRGVGQVTLPAVFPKFLFDECPKHHGVVSCEGSMFKSKFANALSTMMAGSLGMANAEGKLSVGYGAEAGEMTDGLQAFVRRQCRDSLVLCRNVPSRGILEELDVRTTGGTDTAWTFEPAPASRGEQILRDAGWDRKTPVMAICPINPFWWPVKPDVARAVRDQLGKKTDPYHYKSVYYHHQSEEAEAKNDAYLSALAGALNAFRKDHDCFPILVGMEQLDRKACEALLPRLDQQVPLLISDTWDMYDLVSVLRRCRFMVSSRFHAMVTSMPGGVVSAGVTMDERIRNLMDARNTPELSLEVDDPQLEGRLLDVMKRLVKDEDEIRANILRVVPRQVQMMGEMGQVFLDEVRRVYPAFPIPDHGKSWEAHLPPLSRDLQTLMEAK